MQSSSRIRGKETRMSKRISLGLNEAKEDDVKPLGVGVQIVGALITCIFGTAIIIALYHFGIFDLFRHR